VDVHIEIEGANELARAFKQGRRVASQEMRAATDRSLRILQSQVRLRTPVASGRAQRGIETKVEARQKQTLRGLLYSSTSHLKWLIGGTGRFAGKRRHWPDPRAPRLVAWARSRGADPRDIAYYIGRRGGLPKRINLGAAIQASLGPIGHEFDRALERIMRALER